MFFNWMNLDLNIVLGQESHTLLFWDFEAFPTFFCFARPLLSAGTLHSLNTDCSFRISRMKRTATGSFLQPDLHATISGPTCLSVYVALNPAQSAQLQHVEAVTPTSSKLWNAPTTSWTGLQTLVTSLGYMTLRKKRFWRRLRAIATHSPEKGLYWRRIHWDLLNYLSLCPFTSTKPFEVPSSAPG